MPAVCPDPDRVRSRPQNDSSQERDDDVDLDEHDHLYTVHDGTTRRCIFCLTPDPTGTESLVRSSSA